MHSNQINHKILSQIYQQLPVRWEQALLNLIVDYSHVHIKTQTNLILYFNTTTQSLQIVTNAWGLGKQQAVTFWSSDQQIDQWKKWAFCVGQNISLESKANGEAVATCIDLGAEELNVQTKDLDAEQFMKSFVTGSRLTISKLNFKFTKSDFIYLTKWLPVALLPILADQKIKILLNWIDEQGIFFYDGNDFVSIKTLTQAAYLCLPTLPTIQQEIGLSLKPQIEIAGFVVPNYLDHGIYLYDGHQLITTISAAWLTLINPDLQNHFVYLQIDGLLPNSFRSDFCWTAEAKQLFEKQLIETLRAEKQTSDGTELETTKLYLTKAFEISGNGQQFADFEIVKDKLKFVYTADDGKQITINLIKNKQPDHKEWLQLNPVQENVVEQIYEYDVNFNIKHPYFAAFNQRETQLKIEQFVICYAIAETICRLDGSGVTKLKYEIDKILRGKL